MFEMLRKRQTVKERRPSKNRVKKIDEFVNFFTCTEQDTGSDPRPERFPPDWSMATVVL